MVGSEIILIPSRTSNYPDNCEPVQWLLCRNAWCCSFRCALGCHRFILESQPVIRDQLSAPRMISGFGHSRSYHRGSIFSTSNFLCFDTWKKFRPPFFFNSSLLIALLRLFVISLFLSRKILSYHIPISEFQIKFLKIAFTKGLQSTRS